MNKDAKDTIYVDVEDEITGIIDKVKSSKHDIVALVLPKRASVFQSVVNMRLLKRKADDAKKRVVLVTSDDGVLPLAGLAHVHVAKTLQSEPFVPPAPVMSENPIKIKEASITHDDLEEVTGEVDKAKPIGVLAGLSPIPIPSQAKTDDDTIQFDNDKDDEEDSDDKSSKKDKKSKKDKEGKDSKIKVPNFEKFRLVLILGALGIIVLVVLWFIGFKVLPTANVIIETKTSTVNSNLSLTLSSTTSSVDPTNMVVPAKVATQKATAASPQVTTTGTKLVGSPATGNIIVTNSFSNCPNSCDTTGNVTIPSGTVFTDASGNYAYTSTSSEILQSLTSKGASSHSVSIPVSASQVGSSYDINPTSFTSTDPDIEGFPMASQAQFTGGSSTSEQVVSQADITNAEGQITAPNTSSAEQQLEQQLEQQGLRPVIASYSSGSATYTPSAAVGTQADQITVTETITETMYGVLNSDLTTLIDNNVNQQINPANQSILDSGVSGASFSFSSAGASSVQVNMTATSTIGPKLDVSSLPSKLAGMKSGDIENMINSDPGVTNVKVKYSPFWVTATPHNAKKIKITIENSNGATP